MSQNHALNENEKLKVQQFKKRLDSLNKIIAKENLIPIFITQVMFNGLENKVLFNINNELKKFAKSNDYFLITLDEIAKMELNDFYDEIHTAPQGSEKIAKIIYPFLKRFLKVN